MTSQDIIVLELGGDSAPPERLRRRYTWFLRRLALGVLTLLAVSALVFVATQALPGDPARAILGRDATPEHLAAVHKQLGLDRPLASQYLHWLGGVLRGDLGKSIISQQSVTSRLGDHALNSLILVFFAAVISIPLSILLGSWTALRR